MTATLATPATSSPRLWLPQQVLFTPAALDEPFGQQILKRVQRLNLPVEELSSNRITGIRGKDERDTYARAKRTLAVVTAPPSALKLSPIPPSANWQFHLAQGCPAHCQYCYLAGSLSGCTPHQSLCQSTPNFSGVGSLRKTQSANFLRSQLLH